MSRRGADATNASKTRDDFGSLLASFREATGCRPAPDNSRGAASSPHFPDRSNNAARLSTTSDVGNRADRSNQHRQPSSSDCLAKMWRVAQIRRASLSGGVNIGGRGEELKKSSVAQMSAEDERQVNATSGIRRNKVHIAVCLIILDELPHERIWRRWIESGWESQDGRCNEKFANLEYAQPPSFDATADLIIHAKHPERIRSKWVRSKSVSHSFRPEWNDVNIVRALIFIAKAALDDPRTTHVLFATESCIPITSLCYAASVITASKDCTNRQCNHGERLNMGKSFISAYNGRSERCTRFDERSCWSKLEGSLPYDAIWKALPGWCLLSRNHMQEIIDIPHRYLGGQGLWPLFSHVWAPEEMYFPTALALLGYLPGPDVELRGLTHAKWPDRGNCAHPISYDEMFDKKLIDDLRRSGSLFLRKMKRPLDEDIWWKVVSSPCVESLHPPEATANLGEGKKRAHVDDTHDGSRDSQRIKSDADR